MSFCTLSEGKGVLILMKKDGLCEAFIVFIITAIIIESIYWITNLRSISSEDWLKDIIFIIIWSTVWPIVRYILRNIH